jgi:putative transposase
VRKADQNEGIDTSQPAAVPDTVSVSLAELAGEMREGLLALAVGTGLQVMGAIMEEDVAAKCGPKGCHDPERVAVRHGRERGSVSLGGRRVAVTRPRMRAADGSGELPVPSYELFSGTEVLGRMAWTGCSPGSPRGATVSGSSRSGPVPRRPRGARRARRCRGVSSHRLQTALAELLAADLHSLDLVAMMVDGVHFGEHLRGRPRDRHRRHETPVVAGRGLNRERDPGHRAARRAARTRSGHDPPDPDGA